MDWLELYEGLLLPMILGALGAVGTGGWYAARGWVMRQLVDLGVRVVSRLAVEVVHPKKMANSENPDIRRYDLLPEEGVAVMEQAKREVLREAVARDANKAWYAPAIAQVVATKPELVEQVIEKVVQERKGRRRWNSRRRRWE